MHEKLNDFFFQKDKVDDVLGNSVFTQESNKLTLMSVSQNEKIERANLQITFVSENVRINQK
uniref:SHSP domain-containing protein n=1 Tax=Ascaris lumbricoides TaxID=6252 RepID=A0A0M3I2B1_ASCLU